MFFSHDKTHALLKNQVSLHVQKPRTTTVALQMVSAEHLHRKFLGPVEAKPKHPPAAASKTGWVPQQQNDWFSCCCFVQPFSSFAWMVVRIVFCWFNRVQPLLGMVEPTCVPHHASEFASRFLRLSR